MGFQVEKVSHVRRCRVHLKAAANADCVVRTEHTVVVKRIPATIK